MIDLALFLQFSIFAIVIICTVLINRHMLRSRSANHSEESDNSSKPIPCPSAWPLIGNLPQLFWAGYQPEELMMKWSSMYGEIFSFKLGSKLVVVLNSFKLINKAWHHPNLQDRAAPLVYIKALGLGKGLTFANGDEWKECRSFVLKMFRKLGVGKSHFEDVIVQEAGRIVQEIERQGCILDVSYIFSMASCNIISKIVFNQQLEYTDPSLQEQVASVLNHFQMAGPGSLNSMISFFAKIPFGPGEKIVKNYKVMKKVWSKQIQVHLKRESGSENKDIVDAYLEQLQNHLKSGANSRFKLQNLLWLLRDLYLAGTETSSTTMRWAVLFLATHPEKQQMCHEELEGVIDMKCLPRYADHAKLPYINAFIMETLRLGDILPLGVAHKAREDVMLEDYLIPKGAIVTSSVRAVSMDSNTFYQPCEFLPERFLNDKGIYQAMKEMTPFGIGNRICPGEQLARIELFIWFTHLIQSFQVKIAGRTQPDILAASTGLVRSPLPFKVEFIRRKQKKDQI